MKNKRIYVFLASIFLMLLGQLILLTQHNKIILIIGAASLVVGLFYAIAVVFTKWLCEYKHLYKFIHLYTKTDINDTETYIIENNEGQDIKQLKKDTGKDSLCDIFKSRPVLIEKVTSIALDGIGYVKVIGWTYAYTKDDALITIANEHLAEIYEEDEYYQEQINLMG
ncbi:MAG: hypothetical protein IMZ64_09010 [Bacteroidetes bacterium]|nr:hypothetical protein [Bacteroidota bacterium]